MAPLIVRFLMDFLEVNVEINVTVMEHPDGTTERQIELKMERF